MIAAAAIRTAKGVIRTMPPPARHHTILRTMSLGSRRDAEQGFVTDTGEFLNRSAAAAHALECGQVTELPTMDLFSEDLW